MSHAQSWIMRVLWVFHGISMDFGVESHYLPTIVHHLPHLHGSGPYHKTRPPWRWSQEGRSISTFEGLMGNTTSQRRRDAMTWWHMMPYDAIWCHMMPWHAMTFWVLSTYRMSHNPFIHPWAYRFAHLEYLRFPPTLPKRLHLVLYRRIERSGALSAAGPTHVTFHIHQIEWFH